MRYWRLKMALFLSTALVGTMLVSAQRARARDARRRRPARRGRRGRMEPLYDNLGELSHPVSTASELAQKYFDQGLRWTYAFNHAAAVRAFQEAQRQDPNCAMCYWGEAFALGPNINAPMDAGATNPAVVALEKAQAAAHHASAPEQALIEALAARYSDDPDAERAALDQAYADAMAAALRALPRRSRGRRSVRRCGHEHRALGLLGGRRRDAQGADRRGDRGGRGGARGQPRARRRDPPLHPPDRGLDHARARRALRQPPGGADAGRRAHRPHGRARLLPGRPLPGLGRGQQGRGRGGRGLSRQGRRPGLLALRLPSAQRPLRHGLGADGRRCGAACSGYTKRLDGKVSDEVAAQAGWVQAIKQAPYFVHAQFSPTRRRSSTLPDPGDRFPYVQAAWHYARGVASRARASSSQARTEAARIADLAQRADLSYPPDIASWSPT